MVPIAMSAADALAKEGISVEVIDPRTLVPLDSDAILSSVEKCGRLVVVDAGHERCSAAAEIAAIVADRGFWSLRAPIVRVTTPQTHIPFSPPLEKGLYPTVERVIAAVQSTLG
jgi:pyruvate dehydrogenase E1 component beta subunit